MRSHYLFALVLVVAAVLYLQFNTGGGQSPLVSFPAANVNDVTVEADKEVVSPFETVALTANPVSESMQKLNSRAGQSPENVNQGSTIQTDRHEFINVSQIGRGEIEEADHLSLVSRLQSDPDLLQLLIEDFRVETDPERLRRLSQLLGDVNRPAVLDVASELIYSGDPELAAVGRDLLMRIQPGNAEARSFVSGLLSAETDTKAIVGALAGIAHPGKVDDDSRGYIAEQVALLAQHEDAVVRRNSLTVLSRWSYEPRHTNLLLDGLSDVDESVRQAAAFAFVDHDVSDENVVQRLFTFVEDTSQTERARRGAILALKGMQLSSYQMETLLGIEKILDRRPIRTN